MSAKIYDTIILGAGPAGLTAGIYCKRAGMDIVVIEKNMPGGQVGTTYEVCNYPGFDKISGIDLATKMFEHASSIGVEVVFEEVKKVNLTDKIKTVETFSGTYLGKSVIICFGAAARKLNLDNERQYIGKGISYCATCDGALYKDLQVAVVGGGNTAIEDAIYLSNIEKKVYLIHRRDEFRAEKALQDSIKKIGNVEYVLSSVVVGLNGNEKIQSIDVKNLADNTVKNIKIDGLFVAIGRGPETDFLDGVNVDKNGYVISDANMCTNIEGVFVAGDIRNTPLRQIVTACSDGAIAATKAYEYIKR